MTLNTGGVKGPLQRKEMPKIGKNRGKERENRERGKNLEKEEKSGRKGKGLSLCPHDRSDLLRH